MPVEINLVDHKQNAEKLEFLKKFMVHFAVFFDCLERTPTVTEVKECVGFEKIGSARSLLTLFMTQGYIESVDYRDVHSSERKVYLTTERGDEFRVRWEGYAAGMQECLNSPERRNLILRMGEKRQFSMTSGEWASTVNISASAVKAALDKMVEHNLVDMFGRKGGDKYKISSKGMFFLGLAVKLDLSDLNI